MVISFKTIQNRQNLSHPAPLKACRFVQAARAQSRIDHHPTLGKETVHLADVLFAPEQTSKYELVEGLVVYFLYFEFIALIVKYFQSGFHFPLRYFVYIGITAIVRLIIVDHKSPLDVLIYSAAILLLVITLWLCNSKRLKRE